MGLDWRGKARPKGGPIRPVSAEGRDWTGLERQGPPEGRHYAEKTGVPPPGGGDARSARSAAAPKLKFQKVKFQHLLYGIGTLANFYKLSCINL